MKIYVIRHGETYGNDEGKFQGRYNSDLNGQGILLAEETGHALQGVHFDAAFSSPLSRALQTAEIVLRESGNSCAIRTDERLAEMAAGDYENKRISPEAHETDPVFVREFFLNPLTSPPFPGGESVADTMKRTQEFLRETATLDFDTVLVSTHGVALRAMLNFLYDDPSDFWHGCVPLNCSISIIEADNGSLKLLSDDIILYDPQLCNDRFSDFTASESENA